MNVKFEKSKKYLVIALFLIATIFSLIFMGKLLLTITYPIILTIPPKQKYP